MLSFFRRIIHSKVGYVVTFIVLGVIALAFAAGDISNLAGGSTGGLGGNDVATVGKQEITMADLRQRANDEVAAARQRNPQADIAGYLAAGQLDASLDRMISSYALADFGRQQGMIVSKRAVDGQIASIPGLQGPTGKFDENIYRRILVERKLTDAGIRRDIARDIVVQQLVAPTQGATQVPAQIVAPYASLMLERRAGEVAFVPMQAAASGAAPTPAELQTFYAANLQRYRVPERRTIRYALVTPDQVGARAVATPAEIAQAYQQNRAKYQPTEKRTITQVIVADRAGAEAIAAKVKAGTPLAAAARAAGLEASTQTSVEKAAYATQTGTAVADAVFAAPASSVVGPVRGSLGFTVARIESVQQVPGRTLAQVQDELAKEIGVRKSADALAQLHDTLDTALTGGSTFDEAVADAKIKPVTTPALTASATDPNDPLSKPDPALIPIVQAAFTAEDGDAPQLVQTGADGSFAVVAVGQITPAAPRPLAQVRDEVAAAFVADRTRQAARRIAADILAKANRGTPLAQAVRQAGPSLPAPRPIAGARTDLAKQQAGGADPALALLFGMAQGTTKMVEAPQGSGWIVVRLTGIQRGDASKNPAILAATRGQLGQMVGSEYIQQFARAARNQVGVKTNATALKRLRAELAGQGGSDN
ncbi:peptidylprolyl isomerase [Sphingomonas sp. Leaf339]|uniref:peptidylprolyl isomerase n=1 Tax=Sphingomonas sp. Leaf339 TaxID=1736343 RepID=UPI00070224B3|nr:peptidylprolyl isomerase [Sphingomonas sp. Leaf339]KQU62400.1 peptidylprolyl isomerase [Sphingomonas sp. Leaf339]